MAADNPTYFREVPNPYRNRDATPEAPSDVAIILEEFSRRGFVFDRMLPQKRVYRFVPTSQGSHLKTRIYYYPGLVGNLHLITSLSPDLQKFGKILSGAIKGNTLSTEAFVFNTVLKYVNAPPQKNQLVDVYHFTNPETNNQALYLPDSKIAYDLSEGHVPDILGRATNFTFHAQAITIEQLLAQNNQAEAI